MNDIEVKVVEPYEVELSPLFIHYIQTGEMLFPVEEISREEMKRRYEPDNR